MLAASRHRRRFNTQPPEGGWSHADVAAERRILFQHTAARRRLGLIWFWHPRFGLVSTHSRPKAAGSEIGAASLPMLRFNTQPPEGGWNQTIKTINLWDCFNTQPPEGGWTRRLAARLVQRSFNTQPPEGGWEHHTRDSRRRRSFNTQPPEGGWELLFG